MAYRVEKKRFELLAERALQSIPKEFLSEFKNITIVVEDYPDEDTLNSLRVGRDQLLGLFVGQTHYYQNTFFTNYYPYPDTIFLYQKNIEANCSNEDELFNEIRATILHEIGHYFGLSDEELKKY
ncbi:MAG: metallopeptidase family protein [Thermodesulfovibrionales bacterium]|nr:metallopeptidase family protein [Thermodesulfovibrionales bacterium]